MSNSDFLTQMFSATSVGEFKLIHVYHIVCVRETTTKKKKFFFANQLKYFSKCRAVSATSFRVASPTVDIIKVLMKISHTHLSASSCCLFSSSSLSLCSLACRRFSASRRDASSGSVVPAEGRTVGELPEPSIKRKSHRIIIYDASLIELDGSCMVAQYYRPAEGSGLVAGASGSILGGSTSSFLPPSRSGVTLGLSDVTLLGLRLPGNKEGLLGDSGIDAGGGGDLDFLGLNVF